MFRTIPILLFLLSVNLYSSAQFSLPDSVEIKLEKADDTGEQIKILDNYTFDILRQDMPKANYFIDSAIRMARRAGDKYQMHQLYNTKGSYFLYRHLIDSSLKYYKNNLKYYKSADSLEDLMNSYNNVATVYLQINNSDSSIKYGKKALAIAKQVADDSFLSKIYSDLAGSYLSKDDYARALDFIVKSENYLDPTNHIGQTVVNIRKGIIYFQIEDFKKSLHAYEKALMHNGKNKTDDFRQAIYNNLGRLYEILKEDLDSALYYYRKSLQLAEKAGAEYNKAMLYINIGNIYHSRENFSKAYAYYNRAYKSQIINKLPKLLTAASVNLGIVNIELGNIDTADYYVKQGMELASQYDFLEFKRNAFTTKARLDSIQEDYISALSLKDSIIALDQRMWDEELQNRVAELNVEHEVEKQRQQTKHLKEKSALDDRYIRNQRILIIALGVALIFIVFLLVRSRRKSLKLQSLNNLLNKKNKQLEVNYLELKRLNSTKDKFFSIIAHDLKGPIGTQSAMLNELLEDYNSFDKEELYEYLKSLHKNGENSYTLLLNLLDWSRTQQGRISNNPDYIDVGEAVSDVTELLEQRAERKNQLLNNRINTGSFTAYVDDSLLNRVIHNLTNNAIKFTPEGEHIDIEARALNDHIIVSVSDNGIGIPQDKLENLFSLDSNFKRKGTNNESGTGLGLMLCKEFVDLMGGDISVESNPGQGSTFTFTLPTEPVKEKKPANQPADEG